MSRFQGRLGLDLLLSETASPVPVTASFPSWAWEGPCRPAELGIHFRSQVQLGKEGMGLGTRGKGGTRATTRSACSSHAAHSRCFFSSAEAWSRADRVPGTWLMAFNNPKSWIMPL